MQVPGKVLELVLGRLWALEEEGRGVGDGAGRWREQPDPTGSRKDVVGSSERLF